MKIFDIIIENYRQYKGVIPIKFSTDREKNFTIIQGDNGCGKSNIMNAINWCIYGDEMFRSKNNEGRDVINELSIHELKDGDSTRVRVSIRIGEDTVEHEISREITYNKYDGHVMAEQPQFKVVEISDQTGTRKISMPDWFIEKRFIPKELRGFFFFDGEKMDEYFEDTSKVKQNVQRIAQIDILQNSISTLKSTISKISSEMKKQAPNSMIDLETIAQKEDEKERAEFDKENVLNDINSTKHEIDRIDKYLKENSDTVVKEIQEQRELLTKQWKTAVSNQESNDARITTLVSECAPALLCIQALTYSKKLIEEETQKGVLPPSVKDIFLEDLLEKGICICGRELTEGSDSRHTVEKLLAQIIPSDISEDATRGRYVIQGLLDKKDFIEKYTGLLKNREEYKKEVSELSSKLDSISEKLKKYNLEDISQKEEERRRMTTKLEQLHTRKGTLGNRIVQLEGEIVSLREQYSKIETSNNIVNHLRKQFDFANELKEHFKEVEESILDDVREQLEEKTRSYFFNLIWKKNAFSDVRIKDLGNQYRISVLSDKGNECLADISAGETQVLALSFTAALYSVSGYSVPVIIDTPLGRISSEPRDNIASSLPDYLSETQVVMLVTDTEYTDTVRNKLKRSVGAEYKIEHDTTTRTSKVVSYD